MTYQRLSILRKACAAICVLVMGHAAAKADIIIDDFSLPAAAVNYAIAPDANPLVINTTLDANTTRSVRLEVTSPSVAGNNALTGQVGDGLLAASFNVASSGNVQINYAFASSVNFVPTGVSGALQFLGAGDSGFADNIPLSITLLTSAGDLSFTGNLPLTSNFSQVNVDLASLTGTGDLTQVNGLNITMEAGQAADLIFTSLSVTTPEPQTAPVPAPPAMFLALAAIPALGLRRRLAK